MAAGRRGDRVWLDGLDRPDTSAASETGTITATSAASARPSDHDVAPGEPIGTATRLPLS